MKCSFLRLLLLAGFVAAVASCKYLDVVPDNVATLDNAFALRDQAKKFLFTCYSFMPRDGNVGQDPAMESGDEIWRIVANGSTFFNIARGFQNVVTPYGDFYWANMFQGIRDCNIFLADIGGVPDIQEWERRQWIGEVKVLKAYYHFCLMRMYGPVPLIKENLPIDANTDQVQMPRSPVDTCVGYMMQLIDEAVPDLPLTPLDPTQEAGRITQVIALALKAKILVYAASPLFNGNTDQEALKNPDGTALFDQTVSKAKWDTAAAACRAAIAAAASAGLALYDFGPAYQQYRLTDTISTQMSIRGAVTEKWNPEIIWANTLSNASVQSLALPNDFDSRYPENYIPRGELSPPLKIAELFYTSHGVPITEDETWDYQDRYQVRPASDSDALYVKKGYITANLNFDREPRFYADLGFDGGVWWGQGRYDDTQPAGLFVMQARAGQPNAAQSDRSTVTGYFIKKLIHFENVEGSGTSYSINNYPWPIMRLADLYLLYAEALNESEGPGRDAYQYLDKVRERAGVPDVETAWPAYSRNPTEYTTQAGLRKIIHTERLIELAFEGQRFWDLRRWKEAASTLNAPIQGWDLTQPDPAAYYRPVTIFSQTFGSKDYFWPISENNITTDKNLVQNLGW